MKGTLWGISLVVCAVVGLRAWNLMAKRIMQASATTQFELRFNTLFSPTIQQEIREYLELDPLFKQMSCAQLIAKLQHQFPCIEHGIILKKTCGTLDITLSCCKPWRRINDNLILSHEGAIISATIFNEHLLAEIPTITLASTPEQNVVENEACTLFLQNLSLDVCKQFDITWISKTKSILQDKQQPQFSIMVHNDQQLTDSLLSICDHIKNDLNSKGFFKGTRSGQWFADVRFKNQIIVYAQKKGG